MDNNLSLCIREEETSIHSHELLPKFGKCKHTKPICLFLVWFLCFKGISTFMSYLMPKLYL